MADITKCTNKTCKDRDMCYRVQAKSNEFRQSWCKFPREEGRCEWFIPIIGRDNSLANVKLFKCQREFEEESKCEVQCEHCEEYYKPIE